MNYVFISPAYPVTCTHFCNRLSEKGVNVLGIGDVPYDGLNDELKKALTEYYYVESLEDYGQVYRAVAFYIHRYGRIEKIFIDAGIPTARQHIVSDREEGRKFAEAYGYPVIVKPDIGVGANGAMKIESGEELDSFYADLPSEAYVMEEFLSGDICTYDAIIDSHCEPLFESTCTYPPVIDSVQNDEDVCFYTRAVLPESLRDLGRRTVRAFGAGSRFVHFEFISFVLG